MELRAIHTIHTAEGVPIRVELSGIVSRVFAFVVDFIIMLLMMGCLLLVLAFQKELRQVPDLPKVAMSIGGFVIFFGYHLLLEWLWNGKSVGKVVFGLRVVRQDGQGIGFWESLGRNLLRIVDVYGSGIGLLCMLFHPQEKRFGDMLAGTLVIQDRPVRRAEGGRLPSPNSERTVAGRMLTPEEYELLTAYLTRRSQYLKQEQVLLDQAMCEYFAERLHQEIATESDLQELRNAYRIEGSISA